MSEINPIVTSGIYLEYVPKDQFEIPASVEKYGFVNVDEEGNLIFKDANSTAGVRIRDMMNFVSRIEIVDGVLHFFNKDGNASVTLSDLIKEKRAISLSNSLWWNKKRISNKTSSQIHGSHIRNTEILLDRNEKRVNMLNTTFKEVVDLYDAEWQHEMGLAMQGKDSTTQSIARFNTDRVDRLNQRKVEHQWFDLPVDTAIITPLIPSNFGVTINAEIVLNIAAPENIEDETGFNEFLTQFNENPHVANKLNFRLADTIVTRNRKIYSREDKDILGRKLPAELDLDGNAAIIDEFNDATTLDVTTSMRLNTDVNSPYFGKVIVNLTYSGPIPTYTESADEKIMKVVSDPTLEGIQERKISDLYKGLGIRTDEQDCFEGCIPKNYTTVFALAPEYRNKKDEFFRSIDTPHIFRVQWQSLKGVKNRFTYYKSQDPRSFFFTPLYKTETEILPTHTLAEPVAFTPLTGSSKYTLESGVQEYTWAVKIVGGEYKHIEYISNVTAKMNGIGVFDSDSELEFSVEPTDIDSNLPNKVNVEFNVASDGVSVWLQVRTSTINADIHVSRGEMQFDVMEGLNVCESTMEVSIYNMNGHPLDTAQQGVVEFNNEITKRVKFTNEFENQNYSISMTPSGNVKKWWQNKEKDGFTIVLNREFTGTIDWVASKHPNKIPPPTDYQFSSNILGDDPDNFISVNSDYNFSNLELLEDRVDQGEENLLELLKSKRTSIKS
jgi:hypothetical protein